VVAADWSTLRDRGPFSLLFLDARGPKNSGADTVVDLIEPGGVVVLDDFTPCASWPPVFEGRVDVLREQWLTDERFTTVEVMVASDAAVLIAAKR
jgi:predicted O-methyltransferase YrrM